MGFCGMEMKWMMSLNSLNSERKQVVKIENIILKELNDSLGVPQAQDRAVLDLMTSIPERY